MKLKLVVFALLALLSAALFAHNPLPCSACLSTEEIDTSKWVAVPINFKDYDNNGLDVQLESIMVSFPETPLIEKEQAFGELKIVFSAKDAEGMLYKISADRVADQNQTLHQAMDRFMARIKAESGKIIYIGYPQDEQTGVWGYFGFMDSQGVFVRVSLARGMNYIYLLSTHVRDEVYLDGKAPEEGTPAYDKIQHDSHKTYSFADSLNFIY